MSEKIEDDLDCAGSEVENLKTQIAKLQEKLGAAEKRKDDMIEEYESLMNELQPLGAELQSLKEADLMEEKPKLEQ